LRRAVLLLIAVSVVLARPVSVGADNGLTSEQDQIKQRLAAAAAAVSALDQQIAGTERSIADTSKRIQRERQELRLLARTMYAEPESPLLSVFSASSLSDALTRFSDLTAAGDRAAATQRSLTSDLSNLQDQKAAMVADRQKQDQLRQQLDTQFRLLMAPPVTTPTAPAAPAAPMATLPPASPGSIQQIILDAFAPLGSGAQAWALRVAKCESGYNPNAVNRSSGAAGLFQFLPSSWANTPQGRAGQSVFDPTANANAAAWYYKQTGETGSPWSCK
jgi:soluble lytic murein transglycosylase-like protein